MNYESVTAVESTAAPGVRYTVAKMSFGRRTELARQIRELAQKTEFLEAGDNPQSKMDAALLSSEIDRIYVLWGLKEVTGLLLDGKPATPATLASHGPEELFREALAAVKAACELSEIERKN